MKLTGPMMSMSASGSIGGVLTFASNKGRAYARTLVKPSNPKSNLQNAVRAMFTWLSQVWKALDPGDQASWQALADQTKISPFNAFVKEGQNRTKTGTYPVMNAAGTGTPTDIILDPPTIVAQQRQVTLQVQSLSGTEAWGLVTYRTGPYDASGGAPPSGIASEIVAVQTWTNGGTTTDTRVVPGKWYIYTQGTFGETGNWGGIPGGSTEVQVMP